MEPGQHTLSSIEDLQKEAVRFVLTLHPSSNHATLVTLSGNLGAGKTAFVQALAKALGVTEHVTSPTFVLAKNYVLNEQSFTRLAHVDAYRFKEGDDLRSITFEDLYTDPRTLIMLEWPEMVSDGLPPADVAITLEANPDESRTLTYA